MGISFSGAVAVHAAAALPFLCVWGQTSRFLAVRQVNTIVFSGSQIRTEYMDKNSASDIMAVPEDLIEKYGAYILMHI